LGEDGGRIRLRHAETAELKALADAQNEIFQDYIIPMHSSADFFLDFLRSVGGKLTNVIVATDADRIVGYVNPVIDGVEAWIGGVGVKPHYRGKGLGTRLMLAGEEYARAEGAEVVSLEVIMGNQRAYNVYKRLGYADSRIFLTAEGKPIHFAGFGVTPKKASMSEILAIHEKSYQNTCWQRRKLPAIVQSARASECYKVDGGFVILRRIETSGFIPFLGVLPDKRRQGIGTSLAKFALSRLYELGAYKVALYNVNEDQQTLRMLDKFDFAVTLKQVEMVKRL